MTTYETKVLYMHKNKASKDTPEGKYLFIFNDEEKTLGEGVKSLLMNVSDIKELINGSAKLPNGKSRYAKVSIMETSAEDIAKAEAKEASAAADSEGDSL